MGTILSAQSTVDCTDPMMAGTSQCSSATGNSLQSQGPYGTSSSSAPMPSQTMPTGGQGNAAGSNYYANRPGNYSDLERMANPANAWSFQTPPEPLTEFQKFIASTTGQVLPIYGADLFRRIPSTFAPLDMGPVPSDYAVGPGDELRIRLWGQVNFQANLTVDRSGEIYLPQVGPVHVAGLKFAALDEHLRQAVGRVYRNFDLTVDLGRIRAIQIYVAGQARRPGAYTVSSLSTLTDALFASGGPAVQGSMRAIELRRNGAVVTHFDLYDLLIRGDKTKDAKLLPGDVIYIPPVGPQTAVTGSVRNPAIYELLPGESLGAALADAGGATSEAAGAHVSIERIEGRQDRRAMEVDYDAAGLATTLRDGDLIRVYAILPKYEKTVTLRGNLANPGRYAWHEGMRLSDLIPDKDSLFTRNYWWRRAQMGMPAPEFEPIPGLATMRQPADNFPITLGQRQQGLRYGNMGTYGASQNGTGMQGAGSPANQQGPYGYDASQQGPYGYDASQQGTYGYDASQQGTYGYDASQQAGNNSGYPVNGQFGVNQNQFPGAEQRTGSASLAGAQTIAPSQSRNRGPHTEVRLPAPEIDWDYAVIERINQKTLKTELIPFDIGRLVLHHDPSQNLALQPNDIVTVFSQADIHVPVAEETKLVRLEGEFVHAGVYSVHPGETLRDLVRRAGGLTPNAYLYGSMFTRESTRALQQTRIDEYVRDLSLQIQRSSISMAAAAPGAGQALAGGQGMLGGEQMLLSSLQGIRATGRIVIDFHPHSRGLQSIPPVTLEDGDRFVVPSTPSAVNVVGAVYDQNSFLYKPGQRTGAYLHSAGGPTHDADSGHEYVIRADGEVVSRNAVHLPWGDSFADLAVNPGDTIVVPQKALKLPAVIGLSNWSQVFSQLALGAAFLTTMP